MNRTTALPSTPIRGRLKGAEPTQRHGQDADGQPANVAVVPALRTPVREGSKRVGGPRPACGSQPVESAMPITTRHVSPPLGAEAQGP